MRILVYERQVGLASIPGARVAGIGGPEAYGTGMGRAIEALGQRVHRMAEDVEDAQTLEAFNAFKREAFEYHEDPDKGLLNTRLGNGAVGVYRDADAWMGNKAGEYEARMPSARSAQNFRRMAEQYRMQRGERNSRFEADQIKAYRDGEADATIRLGLDEIAENFDNDKAVEAARQQMMLALELKTRGRGTEARRAAYEAMEGQISMTRLARMIQADPMKAEAWFQENKNSFSGENLARAEGAVKKATFAYRMEAARDDLIRRHGMNYAAARKEILDTYQGDDERYVLSLYEAWHSDQKRVQAERERHAEDGFFERLKSIPDKGAAMQYALSHSKSLSGFLRAKSFVNWLHDDRMETEPGRIAAVLQNLEDGKYDGKTLNQIAASEGHGISKEDWKEFVAPEIRERLAENKTQKAIVNSVISGSLTRIRKETGLDKDLPAREAVERRFRLARRENPNMSAEDAEALYRKLATKQKLESSWNPFSGAFWAPRKARGIELEEMEERGFVWNKETRRFEDAEGNYVEE